MEIVRRHARHGTYRKPLLSDALIHRYMGWARGASLVIAALVLASLVPTRPAAGDGVPPAITEIRWDPRYPIHPSNVTISARVMDPDGIAWVQTAFCYLPPWLCLYEQLTDPDGDGIYTGIPVGPNGQSTEPESRVRGATLNVSARDNAGNSIVTQKIPILFADSINMTLEEIVFFAAPGQAFEARGSVFYEANQSAPAEGTTVIVTVTGDEQSVTVDANGAFEANLTAPNADGTYTITATVTDRTLTDSEEATLAVSTIPTPDLTVSNLRMSPLEPVAGPVTIRFDARNVGTDAAQGVHVLVELIEADQAVRVLFDDRMTIQSGGGSIPLVVQANLAAGTYSVRVTLDAEDEISELNEDNNVRVLEFTVHVKPEQGPSLTWIGVGGAAAAASLVGVVAALRRRNSRRKPA